MKDFTSLTTEQAAELLGLAMELCDITRRLEICQPRQLGELVESAAQARGQLENFIFDRKG